MKSRQSEASSIHDEVRSALEDLLPHAIDSAIRRHVLGTAGDDSRGELLSRKQAANALNVSVQTIAVLIRDGMLQSVRVRRRVLIPIRSIEEYLRGQDHVSKGASR